MSGQRAGNAANTILLSVEDAVAVVTLNRPESMNALVDDMRERLGGALREAAGRDDVRVITLTGSGRAFCAGADVQVMAKLVESGDEDTFARYLRAGMEVIREMRRAEKPVIAALNGPAAGAGAALALACDLRAASERASLGITFNRVGLHPDWGATYFLPRLVGYGRAAELVFSGRMVPAGEARQIGLVDRLYPQVDFRKRSGELAVSLARTAPLAFREAKRTLAGDPAGLDQAMEREAEAQMLCFRSPEFREGVAAFLDKRPADFARVGT
ncbi:MAG: enoyl-CoA hydratase/isomerase family protein [Longimicrobiaceae bacterium]